MKTLLLVDGSSYLYRAFHAMPDLRNRKDEPTGAIYGVLNMLRRLHREIAADYSACIFDAKGKTFRDEAYPEYKANRPPMPDDLVRQIEPLKDAIRAMGWPLLVVDGVEADDVIGTLAHEAQSRGVRTVISTGDKDIAQLVNPQVTLVNTLSNETVQPDTVKLGELFERFEFKTWRGELEEKGGNGKDEGATPHTSPARHYETILTEQQLDAWLVKITAAPLVSVDTETTSLDPLQARLVGISFAIEPGHAAYLPLAHRYPGAPPQLDLTKVLARLKPWLEAGHAAKLGQNLKYDKHVFANHGIRLAGIAHDTLLQSYVLESHKPHGMDSLALRHLGVKTITYEEVAGKGAGHIGFDQVTLERASEYAAEDADITLQLHHVLYPQIEGDARLAKVYRDIEMPVMEVLHAMERHGVLLDCELLDAQSQELGAKMLELERAAHTQAGQPFNLNSPKQIQEILFDRHKLPVLKKTPSGAPSTDEDVLEQLALDYPLP
ncbi:MAG: hypothetical protein HYU44_20590, partial [Betaproteobacteria bacterium]|nr:hypothetical protein [Betaproteobacteria bacterium]